jgi:hypothetical protein
MADKRKRPKPEADLTPFEVELQRRYAQQAGAPGARQAAVGKDLGQRKEALVALAREQDQSARARFQRDQELKRQRQRGGTAASFVPPTGLLAPVPSATALEAPTPPVPVTTAPTNAKVREPDFDPAEAHRTVFSCCDLKTEFFPASCFAAPAGDQGEGADRIPPPWELARNPHLAQNEVGFFKVPLEHLPKRLVPSMPRKKYTVVMKSKRSTLHWGVRKLLLSEIDFLRTHSQPGMLVVYAGAAPGIHIPKLAELFPALSFLLLDVAQFRIEDSERVEIWEQEEAFSDATLADVVKRPEPKLFISDIRTASLLPAAERNDGDASVVDDMNRQLDWYKALSPVASLLKFRLPWEEGTTSYMVGDIYFSCFGPQTTTETR